MEIRNLKEEIHQKSNQIVSLQKQIEDSIIPRDEKDKLEESLVI